MIRPALGLPLLALALGLCTGASAQSQEPASPWTVRIGAAHVGFSPKADVSVDGTLVPGGSATASANTTLGLELSYDLAPRWTARFLAGIPPTTTLRGTGTLASAGALGKVTYGPAVLSLTWDALGAGPVRPYVGAGLNYTFVFKSEDAFISQLDVRNAWGPVLEAGAQWSIDRDWSVSIDARKIFLKAKADGTLPAMGGAAAHADVRLDPLVLFLSVGRRF